MLSVGGGVECWECGWFTYYCLKEGLEIIKYDNFCVLNCGKVLGVIEGVDKLTNYTFFRFLTGVDYE